MSTTLRTALQCIRMWPVNQKAGSSRDIDGGGFQPIDTAREKNAPQPPLRQNRQVLGCKCLCPTRRITLMDVFFSSRNQYEDNKILQKSFAWLHNLRSGLWWSLFKVDSDHQDTFVMNPTSDLTHSSQDDDANPPLLISSYEAPPTGVSPEI